MAVSPDLEYFITTDSGPDSILIQWENLNDPHPVKVHYPHQGYGSLSVMVTDFGFVSLGNDPEQSIWIYDLKADREPMVLQLPGLRQELVYGITENEIMTIGPKGIYFISLSDKAIHEPVITAKDFKLEVSDYTVAIVKPKIVVGNLKGELVFFHKLKDGKYSTLKYLRISDCPITDIQTYNDGMVVVTRRGIKYMDFEGRLIYQFDIKGSVQVCLEPLQEYLFDDSPLPSGLVMTRDSIYRLEKNPKSCLFPLGEGNAELRSGKPNLTVVYKGLPPNINSLDMSPFENLFVVGTKDGIVQLWNYNSRTMISSRHFKAPPVTRNGKEVDQPIKNVKFSSSGKTIAIGFTSSLLFTTLDFVEIQTQSFPITADSITFSKCGFYCLLTTYSSITLLSKPISTWSILFQGQPHFKEILSVHFTTSSDSIFLVSSDRHLTTILLPSLEIQTRRIEQTSIPTSSLLLQNDILIFNASLKCKLVTPTGSCKKTFRALGVDKVLEMDGFGVFKAGKVLGLINLNNMRFLAVIGHGYGIDEVCGRDGVLLSLGGGKVNLWKSDYDQVRDLKDNFLEVLERYEGFKCGEVYKVFEDYFYLLQLEYNFEFTCSDESKVDDGTIHISKLSTLMQAMGYHPSKQEINDMQSEIVYARLAEGDRSERIDIITAIKRKRSI